MCSVKGCTNRSSTKSLRQKVLEEKMKITFHALPKSAKRRQLWLNNLKLKESSLPKSVVICSCHFKDEDFDRTSSFYTRLREDAIPSVESPVNAEESSSDSYMEVSDENLSSFLCVLVEEVSYDTADTPIKSEELLLDEHSIDSTSPSDPLEKVLRTLPPRRNDPLRILQRRDESVQVSISFVDKSMLTERHLPGKGTLRNHIATVSGRYQYMTKILKQKCRRNIEKIKNLQTLLRVF